MAVFIPGMFPSLRIALDMNAFRAKTRYTALWRMRMKRACARASLHLRDSYT